MKKIISCFAIIIVLCFAPAAFAEVESTLEADELNFNVKTKEASALGNVVYTHGEDVIRGDKAEGNIDKKITVYGNPVKADARSQTTKLDAKRVAWTADATKKTSGFYEAFENVHIKRDNGDFLNAAYVKADTENNVYDAKGNVEALYEGKYIKAAEAHRNGATFNGKNVAKLEDRVKKYAISAARVEGKINAKDEITDATADQNVVFDHTDKQGLRSRLYGDHAVYSKAKGTLVVTGNAHGLRSDGKKISADMLVYHETTEQVDAIGKTKITFITSK